jgi:hypothetical protein
VTSSRRSELEELAVDEQIGERETPLGRPVHVVRRAVHDAAD